MTFRDAEKVSASIVFSHESCQTSKV